MSGRNPDLNARILFCNKFWNNTKAIHFTDQCRGVSNLMINSHSFGPSLYEWDKWTHCYIRLAALWEGAGRHHRVQDWTAQIPCTITVRKQSISSTWRHNITLHRIRQGRILTLSASSCILSPHFDTFQHLSPELQGDHHNEPIHLLPPLHTTYYGGEIHTFVQAKARWIIMTPCWCPLLINHQEPFCGIKF